MSKCSAACQSFAGDLLLDVAVSWDVAAKKVEVMHFLQLCTMYICCHSILVFDYLTLALTESILRPPGCSSWAVSPHTSPLCLSPVETQSVMMKKRMSVWVPSSHGTTCSAARHDAHSTVCRCTCLAGCWWLSVEIQMLPENPFLEIKVLLAVCVSGFHQLISKTFYITVVGIT